MLVGIVLEFTDNENRKYYPGDVVKCDIIIDSPFEFGCKEIKVRFIVPFNKDEQGHSRVYKNATFYNKNKVAKDFQLEIGINKFKVECEVPQLQENLAGSKS